MCAEILFLRTHADEDIRFILPRLTPLPIPLLVTLHHRHFLYQPIQWPIPFNHALLIQYNPR